MSKSSQGKGRIGAGGLDLPGVQVRTLRVPLNATSGAGVVSTGKKIPPKSQVLNVLVDVEAVTAATTGLTLSAGITSSTVGFLNGVNIATAGIKQGSLASGSVTRGALLRETASGAAAVIPASYITDSEVEIAYNTNVADTGLKGSIVIEFRKLGE